MNSKIKLFLLSSIFFLALSQLILAEGLRERRAFSIFLDQATIARGYTVTAFEDSLKLSLVPGILSESTSVSIEEVFDEEVSLPWNLRKESPVLMFEFHNKEAYDNHKPFYIQFSYDEHSPNLKQVFFYDRNYDAWRPLPTWDFPREKFVRSLIHLPFARIAVFSYPEISSYGEASWYRFKGGNFTASPDFPRGSLLRIHNLGNNKFVDVEVNDFGPDRSIFPNRIIDLDYEAFKKIANKGEGLIDILVEPLRIAPGDYNRKIEVDFAVSSVPEINSRSAVLIREGDGEIVFEKNSDEVVPIASLTKIISTYIFLNEGNNRERLEDIIAYNIQDENYNHKYFNKWQVARINLSPGDLLSKKDLVYSALVRSANNTVESMLRVSGLDRNSFIEKMNAWAREQGAGSVKLYEPTGLDENNVASARDFAFLASKIFEDPIISDASTRKSYRFVTRNDNSLRLRYNSSDLVLNGHRNFKITGSKTGYLQASGYCLVTRAEINGESFLVVILNASSRSESFYETIDLLNYAYYKFK
jgi:serine-type D-Ala-D-Ala endopeptidase (penicillin-binding protein 7)